MSIINTLKRASKAITMLVVATVVSYGAVTCAKPSVAEAGVFKKIKFFSRVVGKAGLGLERAGHAMERRGKAGRFFGRVVEGTGRGMRHASRATNQSVRFVQRGANRVISKVPGGRAAMRGLRVFRKAQRIQNKIIDGAFGRCHSRFCQTARNGAHAFAPM